MKAKKAASVCQSELVVLLCGNAARSRYTFECIQNNLAGYEHLLNVADADSPFTYEIELIVTPVTEKLVFKTKHHGKATLHNVAVREKGKGYKGGFSIYVGSDTCIVNNKK